MMANSLGNSVDVPLRALELLKEADLVVFEEDKAARQALKRAGLHREYLKFNEHNQKATLSEVKAALKKGLSVTYMSDQGTPTLEDPGRALVELAFQIKAKIKVVPGASSVTAALSACPFQISTFSYVGLLPRDSAARLAKLNSLRSALRPLIILDAPYRFANLISSLIESFGQKQRAFVALDISGDEENYFCGSLNEIQTQFSEKNKNLNFVIVIE